MDMNPQHLPRPTDLTMSTDSVIEELPAKIDALLAKEVSGVEEAAVLEEAHTVINEVLGQR